MSRKKSSPFDGVETPEQLAAALQKNAGTLTIAQFKAAQLLSRLRGWNVSIPATSDVQDEAIVPTGINLMEERRKWAEGLHPNDTARDWILNSPDDIFCQRVEKITGIRPDATKEQREAFANRKLQEVLDHVKTVRATVGGRPVTLDEVMSVHAESSPEYRYWSRPTQQEGLDIILGWQTPEGFDWSHEMP